MRARRYDSRNLYLFAASRYRSLVQEPHDNLYVAPDGAEIWRVVPN